MQQGEGKTALMLAAKGGHTETVKALIEAGADVKVTSFVRSKSYDFRSRGFSCMFLYVKHDK